MREHPAVRVALALVLLGLVGTLAADYAATMDEQSAYPTAQELSTDFAGHHGQEIDAWVTVERETDEGFLATNGWLVTAGSLPANLDPGDAVQVHGVARPGPRVEAERLVVTDAGNRRYMFAVSAVAVALTVAMVLRYWRIDRRRLQFEPRPGRGGEGE